MTLHVSADTDRCIGSGNCAFLAPHVFDMSDEGHVVVKGPFAADDEAVREAVRGCPTGALRIEEGS